MPLKTEIFNHVLSEWRRIALRLRKIPETIEMLRLIWIIGPGVESCERGSKKKKSFHPQPHNTCIRVCVLVAYPLAYSEYAPPILQDE